MPVLVAQETSLTGYNAFTTTNWYGQPFTPAATYRAYSVKVHIFRSGDIGGDVVVALRAADANHRPTGPNLCEKHLTNADIPTSSAWTEFVFDTSTVMTSATELVAIIYRTGTGGTCYYWGGTPDKNRCYSFNAGVSWSTQATFSYSIMVYGDTYCTTQDATDLANTTATLNGTLLETDGTIDERGFDIGTVYGSYDQEVTEVGTFGDGAFSLPITGLEAGKSYYVRTKFHHPTYGWFYGADGVAFQCTHDDSLVLFDEYAGTVTAYNLVSGNNWYARLFTPTYGYNEKSFMWYGKRAGTSGETTVSVRAVDVGTGKPTGSDLTSGKVINYCVSSDYGWNEVVFDDDLALTGGTQYAFCIRSTGSGVYYAGSTFEAGSHRCTSVDGGVSWSSPSFPDDLFRSYGDVGIETWPPSNIAAVTAVGVGFLNLSGGGIDQLGFDWGEVDGGPYPNEVTYVVDADTGPFGLTLSPLVALTTYYYRAKAHHAVYGWLYAADVEFTTLPPIPQVLTKPPTNVTYSPPVISAVGDITSPGSTTPDERGFVWGMTSVPGLMGNYAPENTGYDGYTKEDGSFGTGEYTLDIKNLNAGKIYYVRAYAHNSYGYGYGQQIKVVVSDTVNVLYPTSDYSRGIRFSTAPGDWYPTGYPGNGITHYDLVQDKDASLTTPWGYWGLLSGNFVMEKNAFNDNYYTDLFGLSDPIRRTEGVVKIKWRARLLRNTYPYGKFKRELFTGGAQYTGSEYDIIPPGGLDVCEILYVSPHTAIDWTLSEMDDLVAGVALGQEGSFGIACCDFLEIVCIWRNAYARTDPMTQYTGVTGRMNGYVLEDEGDACEVYFEWGETAAYGNETEHQTKDRDSYFYADLDGLDPGIRYHYRAVIATACGETFYGDDSEADYDYGTLILEQAYSVLGVRQPVFTVAPEWTDITEYCMALKTKRGRLHEFDKVEAGTAVFQLDNSAGHFWRYNTAGDYYPDIQPLTLTRLRYRYQGTIYPIWYGVSEAYHPGWKSDGEGGATPVIDMECVDWFKSFNRYSLTAANIKLTEAANPGDSHVHLENVDFLHEGQSVRLYQDEVTETKVIMQVSEALKLIIFTENVVNTYSADAHVKKFPAVLSGQRVTDCLLEMGFPADLMDIDAGQHYVIEHTPPDEGTEILAHMQAVAEAEDGLLFTGRDGHVVFQDSSARMASPYNTSQVTFNDDGTAQKYAHPSLVDDDTFIYNEVKVLGPGIDPQLVVVGDYATEQGPRALVRKESQLYFSTDAFVQAFVLAKRFTTSKLRCDTLLIKPQADQANLYPVVFGYDLSTMVTFNLDTAANPAELSKHYHIEGVEHEWDASSNLWRTWWQLWTVNRYKAFAALHDGYFRNYSDGGTYLEMQQAAEADYAENDGSSHNPYTDPDEIVVGQQLYFSFLGFNGSLWRGFLEFDTSLLLSTDTPIAAFILVHVKESHVDDRLWNLVVVDPSTLANPLAATDYGVLLAETTQQGAETMVRDGLWLAVPLNASGLNLLVAEGVTRLALRSNWDIVASDNDEEDGYTNEYARFDNINTNYPPRLVIQLAE